MDLRSCTSTHKNLAARGLENSTWYFIYYTKMTLTRLTSYLTKKCWGPFNSNLHSLHISIVVDKELKDTNKSNFSGMLLIPGFMKIDQLLNK